LTINIAIGRENLHQNFDKKLELSN